MVLMDPQGNRVLVQTEGHINVVIEGEKSRGAAWSGLRRTLPLFGAAIVASSLVSSVCAVLVTLQVRDAMEARLTSRLEQLSDRLDMVATTVGRNVQIQSDRVAEEVVRVGDRVDRIPAKLDAVAQGTSDTVIAWLSTLKKAPTPVPLVVRTSEGRRR